MFCDENRAVTVTFQLIALSKLLLCVCLLQLWWPRSCSDPWKCHPVWSAGPNSSGHGDWGTEAQRRFHLEHERYNTPNNSAQFRTVWYHNKDLKALKRTCTIHFFCFLISQRSWWRQRCSLRSFVTTWTLTHSPLSLLSPLPSDSRSSRIPQTVSWRTRRTRGSLLRCEALLSPLITLRKPCAADW